MSTLSLIPDIAWIWNPIIGNSSSGTNAAQTTQIARAGRASRAGTRAGRVIRIIRLIRLIRIVKLYKISQQAAKEAEANNDDTQGILSVADIARQIRGNQASKDSSSPADEIRSSMQGQRRRSVSTGKRSIVKENQVEVLNSRQSQELQENSFSINKDSMKNDSNQKSSRVNSDPQSPSQQNKLTETKNNQIAVINEQANEDLNQNEENEPKFQIPEESKVGKKLSELTTKRVIILVLAMMFGLQLFILDTYIQTDTSYKYGLEAMDFYIQKEDYTNFVLSFETYIAKHKGNRIPLIYLEVDNIYAGVQNPYEDDDTDYTDLRSDEIEYVALTSDNQYKFYSFAVFDIRADTRLSAILSIIRTNFICVILAVGSIMFSKDTNDIILGPIESMIQKVTNIAKNPLKAAQEEEQSEYEKSMALQLEESQKKKKKKKTKEAPMETEFLEKTIIQIGALLALGFGEAGSEVIAQNMSNSGGEVNPMIPGKKTMAIFGFCDIRNFTDATEVLQEGVMVFVNEIAEIVHSMVDLFSGSANKNIGDAFLLV